MPLITTIAEFKEYIAVDGNAKMATLLPYIKEAEKLYIVPLLDKEFYEEFLALYEAQEATPLSAANTALLPYIQRCLAYYAQLQAIPHLSVTFGDLGIRQHRGEDSDAAPRWKEEKLQFNALENGDLHADLLLAFLEENAGDYATWAASDANTLNSGFIVRSTAIASRHIDINNSRRVFLQLRATMQQLEARFIRKLISQAQYDELVAELKDEDVSANNLLLIEKIEPIVCKRALFMRLPYMRVSIGQDGIWLYSDVSELRGKEFLAAKEDIKALRCELMDGELGYLADEAELRQFILDNIENYPLIKSSTVYTVQPDPGPTWTPTNDENNKHFIV